MPAVGSVGEVVGKVLARPLRIGKYMMAGISVRALGQAADLSTAGGGKSNSARRVTK
jgi:hypothetical protein